MMEYLDYDAYDEFVALIINYPDLLDKTIIKTEYLKKSLQSLYTIIQDEYKENKCLVVDNMFKNKNFDSGKYFALMSSNIARASKEIKFKSLEKYIITTYKDKCYEYFIKNYNGNNKKLYDNLTKVNELSYNENNYIKAKEMYEVLSQNNKQIKLGFNYLDYSLNLSQNDLLILAGGTGTGKTAYALNLLNNLSKEYQCIYFNLEMSENILYKRLLAINTQIELKELNNINNLDKNKKEELKRAMQDIEDRKIILVNKSVTTEDIRQDILNINTNKHIIAFIDHIGLIKSKGSSLYEKMTNVAKELRTISKDYNCTVIGLCQLSRESQKSEERPKLQDLRDSGEIEQSSRKVLLLYNKSENKENRIQDMEIIIAKNDDGNKIIKSFKFDRYTQKFTEVYNERR